MPGRLSQFYALVLLLTCLVINIAFFAEVREPFLGDEDPTASVKSVFSELDIQAKIAEFYPKIQSKIDTDPVVPPLVSPKEKEEESVPKIEPSVPKTKSPALKEPNRQPAPSVNNPPVKPEIADPMVDPFLPIAPAPQPEPEKKTPPKDELKPKEKTEEAPPKKSEEPAGSDVVPEGSKPNLQTAAVTPVPAPVVADVQPVTADQFKPIMVQPKPTVPVRPSSTPVWDTMDTIQNRPIRYD